MAQTMYRLDEAATNHIKLMANPCNARICPPAYDSPGGGALLRYRKIISLGAATGETSGIITWVPGTNEYVANGAASIYTVFTPSGTTMFGPLSTGPNSPYGQSFRCVAACMRLITNASESNRSGLVYAGNVDANQNYPAAGANVDLNGMILGMPVITRSPVKSLEVLWTPNQGDMNSSTDLGAVSNVIGGDSRSALTIAFSGAPAGTGYTVEVTGVYEVAYGLNSGILTPKEPPVSITPWNVVARAFEKLIHNSPVIIDGLQRASDYIGQAGASYVRAAGARAALGLLTM